MNTVTQKVYPKDVERLVERHGKPFARAVEKLLDSSCEHPADLRRYAEAEVIAAPGTAFAKEMPETERYRIFHCLKCRKFIDDSFSPPVDPPQKSAGVGGDL